ncbi:MAG TPA: hypothetical protein VNA69_10755 [Thermoanaerobaculia bacterium]|nr:hypothetical protein [Thermoanaerobaculia bacterium]
MKPPLVFATASCVILAAACGGDPTYASKPTAPPSPPTFIVFADVTLSLTPEERDSVRSSIEQVVKLLPSEATLYVFPLLEDVERAPALFHGRLPKALSTRDSFDLSQAKAKWQRDIAAKLGQFTAGPAEGRKRTCISGALRKAEVIARDVARPARAEIIIVSDMLEDCSQSLAGGQVSLERKSIASEVQAARTLPDKLLDLRGASVTALLPTVPMGKQNTARPPVHELAAFWREVLDRCGDDKETFRLTTEIPERLKKFEGERQGGL